MTTRFDRPAQLLGYSVIGCVALLAVWRIGLLVKDIDANIQARAVRERAAAVEPERAGEIADDPPFTWTVPPGVGDTIDFDSPSAFTFFEPPAAGSILVVTESDAYGAIVEWVDPATILPRCVCPPADLVTR